MVAGTARSDRDAGMILPASVRIRFRASKRRSIIPSSIPNTPMVSVMITSTRFGGAIFLEIGWQQGRPVENLARSAFPKAEIMVLRDYAGRDRFVRLVD